MQKTLLSVGVLALFGAMTLPASAQMCSPGQQAQASTNTQGGMMCGGTAATDDPMADKSEQKLQSSGGMCACCKNMAMMKGGGMMDGHKGMPGMDMK